MKTITNFNHISLSSSLNEKCFRQKAVEKIKTQFYDQLIFPKIVPFMR